jgi:hypothetical protein
MLKGTYAVQSHNTHNQTWLNSTSQYVSGVTTEFGYGTITFSGTGTWNGVVGSPITGTLTATVTMHHVFDQAASNAAGYLVFAQDSTSSLSGVYNIEPDGHGMMVFNMNGGTSNLFIQVGGPPAVVDGPWTTLLAFEWGSVDATGTARECTDCGVFTGALQQ